MKVIIRKGRLGDLAWLVREDIHVSQVWVKKCLDNGEYLVAISGRERVGFLRFSMFWGVIPYLDMIKAVYPRQGIGTALFNKWSDLMSKKGFNTLMTSAMSDEPEPQAWHRKNGFRKSGSLTFGKRQKTPEVFFIKDL